MGRQLSGHGFSAYRCVAAWSLKMKIIRLRALYPVASFPLLVVVLTSIVWAMDRLSLNVQWNSYFFSYGFFASFIPIVATLTVLVALTNRALVSSILLLVVAALLFFVNEMKIRFLLSPIVLTDYFFLKGIDGSTLKLLRNYVNVWWLVAAIFFLLLVLAFVWRYERPFLRKNASRAAALTVGIFSGWLLMISEPLGSYVYNADSLRVAAYSQLLSQYRGGLLGNLIYTGHEMANASTEPVDVNAVRRLLTNTNMAAAAPLAASMQKPDVVVIQSESFFNPDILKQVGDTSQLLPNLHLAVKEGVAGTMAVPTFGGGTLRTEFEVLTGIPLASYPKIQFPYLQISRENIPGAVQSFNASGYRTIAVHGNSGDFWNRRSAYRSMGFKEFISAHEFSGASYRDGWYLSDHSMTDQIIGALDKSVEPKFIFAVSIEAHGPFRQSPTVHREIRNAIEVPPGLTGDAKEEYLNYAYHISNADQELGRLWKHLKHNGRPYVLVFYGDHLPGFEYVYGASTFDNALPADKQRVPWVAVRSSSNERLHKNLYAWMLPGEVLQLAGLPVPGYLTVADQVGEKAIDAADTTPQPDLDALYSAARLDLEGKFEEVSRKETR